MAKRSKILVALLLVLVMVMATACSDSGEVKQPANVNGDSSVTSGNETTGDNAGDDSGNTTEEKLTIAETVLYEANDIKVTGHRRVRIRQWLHDALRKSVRRSRCRKEGK